MKEKVSYKEDEKGNRFPYIDFGSEYHGKISFRLWVSKTLIKSDEDYVEFPCNGFIHKTEKGNLVLKPSTEYVTYNIYIPCGYRGGASFKVLSPTPEFIVRYSMYRSPCGSLGVSEGALIVVKGDLLKVEWRRTGRLYGNPASGVNIYFPDGGVKEIDGLPDNESLEEIAREVL